MVSLGIGGLFAVGHPAEVRAQTVLCPASLPILINGSCTNGTQGAFSGAALASQAISELSQTTTQETNKEIGKSIAERRDQERERCPAGFSRVDGVCRRRPVAEPARAVPPEKPKAVIERRALQPPPTPFIEPAARFGTWIQVFGDYQKRDASGPGALTINSTGPGSSNLALNIQSRTSTVGFVGGADLTSRGLFFANDGLIAGVTTGYTYSLLKLNTTVAPLVPGNGWYGRE